MLGPAWRGLSAVARTAARCTRRPVPGSSHHYSTSLQPGDLFGQPLHVTHPHLVGPNEITPGISATEYELRRTKLVKQLPNNAVVLIPGGSRRYMRGVAFHEFRQNANMMYLTGIDEPDTACVLRTSDATSRGYEMHVFCQPKDAEEESWNGARTGLDAAKTLFGADETHHLHELTPLIRRLATNADTIYFDRRDAPELAGSRQGEMLRALDNKRTKPLSPLVHRLRSVKSSAEVSLMRRAGAASGRAITDAMRQPWLGKSERELQAYLSYGFVHHGAQRDGYVPVIAGGSRASMIHYTHNDALLTQQDGLVFVDAGAEVGGYLADVSRAWPLSRCFTSPQRDLYEAVLRVERACIKLCVSDSGHGMQYVHERSVDMMRTELRDLGFELRHGDVEKHLYPHRVGHHIGLEIHDCSTLGSFEPFEQGHTVTIEPGCYVSHDDRWPKHFRGIGLRVEDSVCIGSEVPTVLSVEAVKEVADIEALTKEAYQ
ncbi:aminopeptidase [Savitreella phatthalungensis]